MNFGGLGGLSAVYPGQLAAQKQQTQNDIQDLSLQDAQAANAGKEALGKVFQSMVPGAQPNVPPQGPQQPPQPQMQPGQPSQPQQPAAPPPPGPAMGGAAGPQRGMPVGAPPGGAQPQGGPGGPPPQGGGGNPMAALTDKFDLKTAAAAIAKANPGIQPRVLVEALTQALPYLNAEAKQQVAEMRMQMQSEQLQARRESLDERQRHNQETEDAARGRMSERQREFDVKEKRLEAKTQVQQDQAWQRLENQKHDIERKIASGDRTASLAQWRQTVDLQHKKAMEVISAYSVNNSLDDKQRKDLIAEQQKVYGQQLEQMRNMPSTGGGSQPGGGKTQGRVGDQPKPIPPELRAEYDAFVKANPDSKGAALEKLKSDGYVTDGL